MEQTRIRHGSSQREQRCCSPWRPVRAAASPAPTGGGRRDGRHRLDRSGRDHRGIECLRHRPDHAQHLGWLPGDRRGLQAGRRGLHEDPPERDFTVFSTDLRGFEQKLTTALPSKTAGEVVIRTTNFLARFIDQGLLAPAAR